jgi:hypothetical protein
MIASRFRIAFAVALSAGMLIQAHPNTARAEEAAATKLTCKGCVKAKQLANDAVTHKKIKDGTIRNKDLDQDAKASGAADTDNNDTPDVVSNTIVATVPLNAPSDGRAIVSANGHFVFQALNGLDCSITTGSMIEGDLHTITGYVAGVHAIPFNRQAVFSVNAGLTVFNFVCSRFGTSDAISAANVNMIALFVPNNYTAP